MSIQVDPRELFSSIPAAPKAMEEMLKWARNLTAVLKLREEKDLYRNYTPDYAATLEFSPTISNIFIVNTVHATGNCTINAKTGKKGPVWIIVNNDATSGKVITFGTGFASTGTLTGTAGETAVVEFISDGNTLYEVSRTTGLT